MAISRNRIYEAAYEVNRRAATALPKDVRVKFQEIFDTENKPLQKYVLQKIIENYHVAEEDNRPICADVGVPQYYVKIGNAAVIDGGFIEFEKALRQGMEKVTKDIAMRSNRAHPVNRKNPGNNVGIHAPGINYRFEPGGNWVEITSVQKGGAFGSDFRMLFAGDSVPGIKRFFMDTVCEFAKRGLSCAPVIIGVGLGGSKDQSFSLGKEAASLRVIGSRNPDPEIAKLELELLEMANSLGIGAMGYPGDTYALDVHIEVAHAHSALLPVGIHQQCQAVRRATARVTESEITYLEDPNWFTPYYLREGIE